MSPRITERYVADVAHLLTPREFGIIESLDRVRLATTQQLERLHFTAGSAQANARQARQTLKRLRERRIVALLERRIGGVRAGSRGSVHTLDAAGQRLASACGPAGGTRIRRPWTQGLAFLRHQAAVTELYVRLVEKSRLGRLEVLDFDAEPLCWRTFTGLGGGRTILKPDAFVRLGLGEFEDAYFVEVDRATHSGPSVSRKLALYRRYWQTGREQQRRDGVFPKVLLLVPSEARRAALDKVASAQPADSRALFQVALYDDALEVFAGRLS